jgi:hypothetical protein
MFAVLSESGRGPRGSARELADNQANRQTSLRTCSVPRWLTGWVSTVMRRAARWTRRKQLPCRRVESPLGLLLPLRDCLKKLLLLVAL